METLVLTETEIKDFFPILVIIARAESIFSFSLSFFSLSVNAAHTHTLSVFAHGWYLLPMGAVNLPTIYCLSGRLVLVSDRDMKTTIKS